MKTGRDKKILDGIRNHDSRIIKDLYNKCLPQIEKMVSTYGGDKNAAEDVFQEAMLIIYRKVKNNDLVLHCKISTYIHAVCKNLWIQQYRSGKYTTSMSSEPLDMVSEPDSKNEKELKILEIFDRQFSRLSKDCQKILQMYFKGHKMKEIKKAMNYDNMQHTNDRKYRCKASLIRRITNDPEYKKLKNENKDESDPLHGRNAG